MARGLMKRIVWFDEFAFIPKNIELSFKNTAHFIKIIPMPTVNMETKFMSKLINLQLLEHNNKERKKKLVRRCYPYDGK